MSRPQRRCGLEARFTKRYIDVDCKPVATASAIVGLRGCKSVKLLSMTTDERLARLTERHEALAESLQLLTADVQSLARSVKEHDLVLRGHADLIGDLVKVATAHERRIGRLEGR
jgi:hypothetical protein